MRRKLRMRGQDIDTMDDGTMAKEDDGQTPSSFCSPALQTLLLRTSPHFCCMISMWMLKKIEEAKRREVKERFVEKRFVERKRGLKE
jgi:hypothetical protein